MRKINPRMMRWNAFVISLLWLTAPTILAQANWWNPNWSYRIPLTVEPDYTEQPNRTVAATINFSIALKSVRARGIFVSNTLRIIEVNAGGIRVDESVPLQFDFAPDYHASKKAQGALQFLLKGPTNTRRFFYLYFDTHESPILTNLLAPYRLKEMLAVTQPDSTLQLAEQVVVNVGEAEARSAKPSPRPRKVTVENMSRNDTLEAELNGAEPIWKSKPEHQFFAGYCTWYAARKWKEFTGTPVTWSGDGGRWFDNAADEGRNVSEDPKAAVKGAIIVWTRRGSAGHVAFIEAVNEEGVFITEMNARGRWMISDAFLPFTNLDKGAKYRFKGYILPE